MEAIARGWVTTQDSRLFGATPQVWASQPLEYAGEPLAGGPSAAHSKSAMETKTMDSRKYYGVSFMKLEDLASGREKKIIYGSEDGKYDKVNLIFTDNTALSLNATNWRTLTKVLGFETEDWPGAIVEVAAGELKYEGRVNPALVITSVEPAAKPVAKAKPDGDDSIPF
jgi:hypothetical protein